LSDNDEQVELAAVLLPTTADSNELDRVETELERSPLVRSATWTVGTSM
jgi:putative Mg2+ transporter-C (MgtC) family protein